MGKQSPLDPEGVVIQIAYPGHIEALAIPLITLRELLENGIFVAPEWAAFWRKQGHPELASKVMERAKQGEELVDWLDECRIGVARKSGGSN